MRKPGVEIFRLALDLAQKAPERAAFIDNTSMFVQIAERFRMNGILHVSYEAACVKLTSLGLQASEVT